MRGRTDGRQCQFRWFHREPPLQGAEIQTHVLADERASTAMSCVDGLYISNSSVILTMSHELECFVYLPSTELCPQKISTSLLLYLLFGTVIGVLYPPLDQRLYSYASCGLHDQCSLYPKFVYVCHWSIESLLALAWWKIITVNLVPVGVDVCNRLLQSRLCSCPTLVASIVFESSSR